MKAFTDRLTALFILALILFMQSACSATSQGTRQVVDDRPVDLSKIYVDFVGVATDSVSIENRKLLKTELSRQLQAENLLQEDPAIHSLFLRTVIIAYDHNLLDVQSELYDDDQFLVYSRVQRQIPDQSKWPEAMTLVAEQLLDELMTQLRARAAYIEQMRPTYGTYPVAAGVYYGSWGWWRNQQNSGQHGHEPKHHPSQPKPEKHWIDDSIKAALPRSHEVSIGKPTRPQTPKTKLEEWSAPSSHSSDSGYSWSTGPGYNAGSRAGSVTNHPRTEASPIRVDPLPDAGYSVPQSSPIWSPPASHSSTRTEPVYHPEPSYSAPQPSPAPVFEPPVSHSAPHHESSAPAPSSPPPTSAVGSAAPGSHHHKHE